MAIKVGKKIRYVRKQRGYTQYQLADAVNADVSTINKIENDKANPSLDMLEKLAAALGVKITELLEDQAS